MTGKGERPGFTIAIAGLKRARGAEDLPWIEPDDDSAMQDAIDKALAPPEQSAEKQQGEQGGGEE